MAEAYRNVATAPSQINGSVSVLNNIFSRKKNLLKGLPLSNHINYNNKSIYFSAESK